jgi:membrane protein required for colicin V production
MNWTDVVILGVLALSVLIGLFRGLVAEILSLVIWVAAFWATWAFGPIVAEQLQQAIKLPSLRNAVAYGICFVAVLILGAIIRFMVKRLIWSSGLSGIDRLFGMVFGFLRGVLIVTVLVFLVGMTGLTREAWWRESALAPQFQSAAAWLGQAIPASVPNSVREHLNPDAMLDKIHPADVLKHLPNLSTLPHAPMFGAPAAPSTVSPAPAAATSAPRVSTPSSTY